MSGKALAAGTHFRFQVLKNAATKFDVAATLPLGESESRLRRGV